MLYGDVNLFFKEIKNKHLIIEQELKKEFKIKSDELKRNYDKDLLIKREQLINKLNNDFNKSKQELINNYKLKVLSAQEEIKNKLITDLINKLIKRVHEESVSKSDKYYLMIKSLINDSISNLEGKSFNIHLSENDSWVKSKIKSDFKDYSMKFFVDKSIKYGVIVFNKQNNIFINNTIESRLINLRDEVYKIVTEGLKWEL